MVFAYAGDITSKTSWCISLRFHVHMKVRPMLNVAVHISRVAVVVILAVQVESTLGQQSPDASCCMQPYQTLAPLAVATPRRVPGWEPEAGQPSRQPFEQRLDPQGNIAASRQVGHRGQIGHSDRRERDGAPSGNLVPRNRDRGHLTSVPVGDSVGRAATLRAPVWRQDLLKGAALARQSGRPLLIQVTANWCGYCRKMKAEVFSQPELQRNLVRGFVTVELDADKNRDLIKRLGIRSLPTTIILAPDMQIVDRLEGFQSAQQLQVKLNRFLTTAKFQQGIEIASREE